MSTVLSNGLAAQKVTPEVILDNIAKAKKSFVLSKEAAGEAVARAYLVWTDTMSSKAHVDSINWMNEEIKKRNAAIDQHNKEEKELRDKAKKYVEGRLKEDNWLNSNPETEAERDELAKERARLKSLNAMSPEEWTARRKVRVDAREGASKFIKVVKFVFDFDSPSDSSLTSRYATVLEWVDAKFGNELINDLVEITEAIKAAGGFENALNMQRGNKPEDEQAIKDREAIAKAIAEQAKAAVQSAAAKATFEMKIKNAPEGIVLVLGRYIDGKVEVVGEMPLASDRLNKVVSDFNDEDLLPTNDQVEFIARVLALGQLVDEGRTSNITEDGLQAGKKELERRMLTLVPSERTGLELVVSARFADASVVIKAIPNIGRLDLGKVEFPIMMPWKQSNDLGKKLEDPSKRRLLDVMPEYNEDEYSWIVSNSALIAIGSDNAEESFSFDALENEPNMPLDVDIFKPQFAVNTSIDDLGKLYHLCLKTWKDTKDGTKNDKHMTLTFKDNGMTYEFPGKPSHTLPCAGANPVGVTMKFRPRDIHDLVLLLTQQHVDQVKVAGDSSGLLCVSWADNVGHYSVYLPTATSDHKLEHRRVAPMRIEADISLAA